MAFRFHRRITLFPGVRLNLGKTGVSVSAGVRGATVTAGKRGVHGNVGLPGTGLSSRQRLDKATGFEADTYLLQAQVSREQWQQLNLRSAQQIDPIAALALFQLNRDMTKTGIFKPIQPK